MKKLIAFTSAAVAATALFAAPQVSNVTMTQDAGKTVTITYELKGEPGIVTVDIQTNTLSDATGEWVSIGGKHLTYFAGDANKIVQPTSAGETRKITWKPRKAWPDNEVTEKVKAVLSAWSLNAPPDYMVTSLTAPSNTWFYTCAENVPFGVTDDLYKTEYLVMRKIPAANVLWRMGSPTTEKGHADPRETPHLVTLSNDFYICVYEITQRQWELSVSERWKNTYFNLEADYMTRPIENVSWQDIRGADAAYVWPDHGHDVNPENFLGKLRTKTGINTLDLPTNAQFEFAMRAGCGTALYDGNDLDGDGTTSQNMNALARYKMNGGHVSGTTAPGKTCTTENGTAKVGTYKPNAWGLYDMGGNLSEWVLDWYPVDNSPIGFDYEIGPDNGEYRIIRGGNFGDKANACRSASYWRDKPNSRQYYIGFRLACPADFNGQGE